MVEEYLYEATVDIVKASKEPMEIPNGCSTWRNSNKQIQNPFCRICISMGEVSSYIPKDHIALVGLWRTQQLVIYHKGQEPP